MSLAGRLLVVEQEEQVRGLLRTVLRGRSRDSGRLDEFAPSARHRIESEAKIRQRSCGLQQLLAEHSTCPSCLRILAEKRFAFGRKARMSHYAAHPNRRRNISHGPLTRTSRDRIQDVEGATLMSQAREIHCFDYITHPYEQVRSALTEDVLAVFQSATRAAASSSLVETCHPVAARMGGGDDATPFSTNESGTFSLSNNGN